MYVQSIFDKGHVHTSFFIFWTVHQLYVPSTDCVQQKSFMQKSGFAGSPECGPAADSKSIKVFIQPFPLPAFPFAGAEAAAVAAGSAGAAESKERRKDFCTGRPLAPALLAI